MRDKQRLKCLMLLLWLVALPSFGQGGAWLVDVKGAIGPGTADHMVRGLDQAQQAGAKLGGGCELTRPGGLDTALRGND